MNAITRLFKRIVAGDSTLAAGRKGEQAVVVEPMEARVLMSATMLTAGTHDTAQSDDRPTEEVSFYYNKIAFRY